MRIAVLDDDLLLLEQIKGTLECHQHVCHTFADGTSLLQALRQETFDLLLVDWHLPDMEGTDVVQTVRNTHGMLPPILFITRRNDERDVVEALSRGADDFMSKPLRMGELVARTTALLRRAFPQSMGARLDFGTVLTRNNAPCNTTAKPSASSTANTNSRCSYFATRAACCPAPTCARPCGAMPPIPPRAPWTPTCRGCAASWS